MEELLGRDRLAEALRGKVREVILALAEAELAEVLRAGSYERREGRRGYRNGKRLRGVSTGLGATVIELPRARITEGEGGQRMAERIDRALPAASSVSGSSAVGLLSEWRQRAADSGSTFTASARGAAVEECDLASDGAAPSAVYQGHSRSLGSEAVVFLYLDAIALRVRIAKKVISVPVLVGLGVKEDGQKVILDLELFQRRVQFVLGGIFRGAYQPGAQAPCLVIIDGNKWLRGAVQKNWPATAVQRCTVHKLRNLERHAPRHALEEVKSDYHRIVYAESLEQATKAHRDFISKWKKLAPKVAVSLEEA